MFATNKQSKRLVGYFVVLAIIGFLAGAISSPAVADGGSIPPDPVEDTIPDTNGTVDCYPEGDSTESQLIYDLATLLITVGI